MQDNDLIPLENQKGVEYTPPSYKIYYSEACLFKEAEEILLFNERNYNVSVSVDLMTNKMIPSIVSSTQVQSRTLS